MSSVIKILATTLLCSIFLQDSAVGQSTRCRLSILKNIHHTALPHVKNLQNRYEQESDGHKCRPVFQMKDHPNCNLSGMDRLALSSFRLSLVVDVLENMAQDSLVKKNLETFGITLTKMSQCEAPKSQQADICLRRLKKAMEKVSTECLQSNVLVNLIWTLHEDVGLVLKDHNGSLPVNPNVQSVKKRRRGRKHKGKKSKAKSEKAAEQQKI